MESLKIGLCQITSIDDRLANERQIFSLLSSIPKNSGLRLLCFPENSLFMRLKDGGAVEEFNLTNPSLLRLSDWAVKNKVNIHLGSLPIREGNHVYNGSVLIGEDGQLLSSYRKIHLFDITLNQGPRYLESETFNHGSNPQVLMIDGWKIGQTICYDLRFAELFSVYAKQEVDLILVPSAFLVKTGEAHWHVLLRARAIESQCYVLASAQAGVHKSPRGSRETYGHSLAVDPWGRVLVEALETPSLRILELHKSEIADVRRQIPMKSHRRIS
ncbi:MAG: carbon-nitrogen hydrolase family protein [Bdellovibrionaceae bacterium]|nr:carbon-nitrogen hydrolase family protein [Pseudobdellovibrionaceae bacterium]